MVCIRSMQQGRSYAKRRELKTTNTWLVGNENGAKNAAFGLSPCDKPKIEFQADPKMESRSIDAWPVALGKEDLLQKEEWKKSKNWLVGDEKGPKMVMLCLAHIQTQSDRFRPNQVPKSHNIDACGVALGKEDPMQK